MDPIKLSISDYVNTLQQNVRRREYTKHLVNICTIAPALTVFVHKTRIQVQVEFGPQHFLLFVFLVNLGGWVCRDGH